MLPVIIGVVVLLILLVGGWYAYSTQQAAKASAEKQIADEAAARASAAQSQADAAAAQAAATKSAQDAAAAKAAQDAANAAAAQAAAAQAASDRAGVCLTDTEARVLPTYAGDMTHLQCQAAARTAGAAYFGIQFRGNGSDQGNTGQCFYGAKPPADTPLASNCTKDAAGLLYGGGWSNAVYPTSVVLPEAPCGGGTYCNGVPIPLADAKSGTTVCGGGMNRYLCNNGSWSLTGAKCASSDYGACP